MVDLCTRVLCGSVSIRVHLQLLGWQSSSGDEGSAESAAEAGETTQETLRSGRRLCLSLTVVNLQRTWKRMRLWKGEFLRGAWGEVGVGKP